MSKMQRVRIYCSVHDSYFAQQHTAHLQAAAPRRRHTALQVDALPPPRENVHVVTITVIDS